MYNYKHQRGRKEVTKIMSKQKIMTALMIAVLAALIITKAVH